MTENDSRVVPATPANIAKAAACLRADGLVAMPTETVYGLAALATSESAVAAIYQAKGRPAFNPLIAHFAELAAVAREVRLDVQARKLAEAFWPGPLTLVAPVISPSAVSLLARAGLNTLAVRVPRHETALALIAAVGAPLVAPSANRSGRVSPTRAEHVAADLAGRVDWILDAGPSLHGLESTIVACVDGGVQLLRDGAITREALEEVLGQRVRPASEQGGQTVVSPGALASHYAPRAALRLNAVTVRPGEAALDFGAVLAPSGPMHRLDLSESGDLAEAATNLFAHLRALDALGVETIAAAPVPESGLGTAINDRLRRAAAPRPATP